MNTVSPVKSNTPSFGMASFVEKEVVSEAGKYFKGARRLRSQMSQLHRASQRNGLDVVRSLSDYGNGRLLITDTIITKMTKIKGTAKKPQVLGERSFYIQNIADKKLFNLQGELTQNELYYQGNKVSLNRQVVKRNKVLDALQQLRDDILAAANAKNNQTMEKITKSHGNNIPKY